jgi:predicted nucleotidyltransferase
VRSLEDILSADAATRLVAYRRALDRALPDAVEAMILFGSRARGDAHPDSDYDLAVLLRGDLARQPDIRAKVADEAFEHMIEGYAFTPIPLRGDYIRPVAGRYRTELARRIAQEGVPVP